MTPGALFKETGRDHNARKRPIRGMKGKQMKASIERHNGVLKIHINEELLEPLAFRSFRPEQRNLRDFHEAGIRLMNVLCTGLDCTLDVPYSLFGEIWRGIGDYDFGVLDRQMELFLSNAPDAYINLMLQLDTRKWYLESHPECSDSYRNLVEMAGYKVWREDTRKYLRDVIGYAEKTYGDRIFAYSLVCGSSNEWYTNPRAPGHPESWIRYHPVKEDCYRAYTGDPAAALPRVEDIFVTNHGSLRDPDRDSEALRYWRFHHGVIADAILYFAAAVKETTRRSKLVGLFYGYLHTLKGQRLLHEGHLGYEAVWKSPDVDMIYSPAKYGEPRSYTGASGYLTSVDSLAVNGTLTFHEIDLRTHIAPTHLENGVEVPGVSSRPVDAWQTRMILRREYLLARTKRTGIWWFDFFGGYYYSPELMGEISTLVRAQRRLAEVPTRSVSEIAVFGDVESMYFASAHAGLSDDLLVGPPEALSRIGAPYDLFTFSDLQSDAIDHEQYTVYIFLNAFVISDSARSFIENRVMTGGNTVLWLYAPGYIRDGGFSLRSLSEITNMNVAEYDGVRSEVELLPEHCLDSSWNGVTFSFTHSVLPLFCVEDERAATLGRYASSGKAAIAERISPAFRSIYSAVGSLPSVFYREVARRAGVHVYYDGQSPVYVNDRIIGVQRQLGEHVRIVLPQGSATEFEDVFDDGRILSREGILEPELAAGETKLYLALDGSIGASR